MQTVGRFNIGVIGYTGILILKKLKNFISKDLSTKTLSCTLLITRDTHNMEQEKPSANIKPGMFIQNFD